jgi:hypothetical protein
MTMRSWLKLAAALLGTGMLTSCSTLETSEDYDRAVDFSKFKTYAWKETEPISNQLLAQRIQSAIGSTLSSRGLQKAPEGAFPDLWVVPHTRLSKQTQVNTYSTGWGYGWGWGWGGGMGSTTSTVTEIPVGTLIIDLVDANKKQLVWRGTASRTLEPDASPEKKEKNITEAVQKMFASYPPAAPK